MVARGSYSFTFDERDLVFIDQKWFTLVTKCMNVGSPSRRFCLIFLNRSFYEKTSSTAKPVVINFIIRCLSVHNQAWYQIR